MQDAEKLWGVICGTFHIENSTIYTFRKFPDSAKYTFPIKRTFLMVWRCSNWFYHFNLASFEFLCKQNRILWFRNMDIEKAWRRTFEENQNENAKMDSRPHVERQEKEWRYSSHPRSSVHHRQSTGGQVEMVWACTMLRRGGLSQENLGGRGTWTTE